MLRLTVEGAMDAVVKELARLPIQTASRASRQSSTRSSSRTTGSADELRCLFESLRERSRSTTLVELGPRPHWSSVNIAFYPSVRDNEALSDYAKELPESLRALFAGRRSFDLANPVGYLNSQVFRADGSARSYSSSRSVRAPAPLPARRKRGRSIYCSPHPLRRRDYVIQRSLALAVLIADLGFVLLGAVALGSAAVGLEIGFDRLVARDRERDVAGQALRFGFRSRS